MGVPLRCFQLISVRNLSEGSLVDQRGPCNNHPPHTHSPSPLFTQGFILDPYEVDDLHVRMGGARLDSHDDAVDLESPSSRAHQFVYGLTADLGAAPAAPAVVFPFHSRYGSPSSDRWGLPYDTLTFPAPVCVMARCDTPGGGGGGGAGSAEWVNVEWERHDAEPVYIKVRFGFGYFRWHWEGVVWCVCSVV